MADEFQNGAINDQKDDTLLSLNLGIGDALQLQDLFALETRYYVKLIGFLNKAGIIVSMPVIAGPAGGETRVAVEQGKNFLVRGFSGRKTYEFNANVMSVSTVPYPHLHLTFPVQVHTMTMRAALRIKPRSLSGWIDVAGADSPAGKVPIVIVDLSTSGARVHTRRKIGAIGEEVKVMLQLPIDSEEQVIAISAVIRKSYTEMLPEITNGGEVTTYGLEFVQPEGNVRMALQGYIYRYMAEG